MTKLVGLLVLLVLSMVRIDSKEIDVATEYPVLPHNSSEKDSTELQPPEPEDVATTSIKNKTQGVDLHPEHREDSSSSDLDLPSESSHSNQTKVIDNEVGQPTLDKQLDKLDKDLDGFMFSTLENLAAKLKCGDASHGLSVLDPVSLDDRNLSPIVGHEAFDVRLRNTTLSGLSQYRVQQVESKIRDMRIKITLHFPLVMGEANFVANGTLMDIFTVSGNGTCQLSFHNVYARTILYLTQQDGKLQVDSADQPYMDFSSATVRLRNSENASRKLQQYGVANQLAPLIFWLFAGDLVERVDDELSNYLNGALRSFPAPEVVRKLSLTVRTLRVRVPVRPLPYAYISPVYFHPINGILN